MLDEAIYASLNHYVHTVGLPNIFGAHSAGTFPDMSKDIDGKDIASLRQDGSRRVLVCFCRLTFVFFGRFNPDLGQGLRGCFIDVAATSACIWPDIWGLSWPAHELNHPYVGVSVLQFFDESQA